MKRILTVLLLGLILISCGNNGTSSSLGSPKKNNEMEKYNSYVQTYNNLIQLDKDIDSYFEEAGTEEKLNTSNKTFNGVSMTLHPNLIENLKKNSSENPKMKELDEAAKKLFPTMEELSTLFEDMKNYYVGKEYLSDDYVKGQELHKRMLSSVKKYDEAFAVFAKAFDKKAKEVNEKELKEMKARKNLIGYNRLLVLNISRDILDEIHNQKLYADNVTTGKTDKFKASLAELTKVLEELQKVSKDSNQLKKEGYRDGELDSFIREAIEYKGATAELINRIEKQVKVDAYYLENRTFLYNQEGTPEKVEKLFSELVREYNLLN